MVVQVQQILYASLAASLLSAFLAMLGKQWLNRYASIDVRGSAIERSQNRQRKLDGIIRWYFDHVLESLPLMLQVALLLLGCALSLYLWGINTAVASVVVCVTSFGVLFYLSVIVAGVISDGCPYQTPWTSIIRRLAHLLLHLFAEHSILYQSLSEIRDDDFSKCTIVIIILICPLILPALLAWDVFRLGRAMFRSLVVLARKVHGRLFRTPHVPEQALDPRAATLDFRCISWMLRTSLDKTINLLTLNYLKTTLVLPGFNSGIVVDCFNTFSNCFVADSDGGRSITRGSEQLAEISAMCFLCTFSSLLMAEPTSAIITDLRQQYKRVFPGTISFHSPTHHLIVARTVPRLFFGFMSRGSIDWGRYNPSFDELVPFAHALAQVTQLECHRGKHKNRKVPRWLVRFALRFLSQDPLPLASVVIDCLAIVATDLGCNVSDISSVASDEKCVHTPRWLSLC